MQLYTFKGEVVLDPFSGVGTTAIAAIQSGRHFICFDNNPDYVEQARNRIKNVTSQKKLGDFTV